MSVDTNRSFLDIRLGLAIAFASVALVAGGCTSNDEPTPEPNERAEACGTIQEARRDQFEPVIGAMLVLQDTAATPEQVEEAVRNLQTGLEAMNRSMATAAGQTTDTELKDAATALATAARQAADTVASAGGDTEALATVLEASGFAEAEATIVDLCGDTWQDRP